jgi:methylthioribose-1-phosphate isomerase
LANQELTAAANPVQQNGVGPYNTLEWRPAAGGQPEALLLLDQLLLPHKAVMVACLDYLAVGQAISTMQVRGAPALGVTGAYGMALAAIRSAATRPDELLADLAIAGKHLYETRPTAVNLGWAINRCQKLALRLVQEGRSVEEIRAELLTLAKQIHEDDIRINRQMGAFGAELIPDGGQVLTHCNTGALATAGFGTALGVIRAAHEAGKKIHVWVDETRPYLQGARLTAWELHQLEIPYTLITDSMAGHLMSRGQVQFIVTGADRIAANGDTANKIGTYSLGVLAHAHDIPFYIAAPLSTIDLSIPDGSHIPIEERSVVEVTTIGGTRMAPEGAKAAHPAFDVTPARYIHGIITERGVARPPFNDSIKALFEEE